MSIRGIDTQIMISRLTDNARDTSAMQKRPEVLQQTLAAHAKVTDAQEQTRVAKTIESEMERIRTEVDEEGGAEAGEGEGHHGHGKKKEEEVSKDMLVPAGNNIIDILA